VVHYRTERITEQQQEQVRTGLKTELDERHRRTEPELAWLPSVSESWTPGAAGLARGVVDGSISGDLARDEHDRIARDLGQVQLGAARTLYITLKPPRASL
jgi:hypothetical protein